MGEFDGADGYGDQYDLETFMRRVLSVRDAPLRCRQVERHLVTVDAPTVAAHLQGVLAAAAAGDERAAELVFPVAHVIGAATGDVSLALEAIDLEARAAELHGVAWILLNPPPARLIDPRALARMGGASQSLGHRRAQAGLPDLRALERLTLDDHPMVIERLCANPRALESHVMAIVTRRPTVDTLIATAAASRWYQRESVREAIALNPYSPTGLALRTLPTLGQRRWASVRHATQVHDAVRAFTEYLTRLRMGDAGGPGPDSVVDARH